MKLETKMCNISRIAHTAICTLIQSKVVRQGVQQLALQPHYHNKNHGVFQVYLEKIFFHWISLCSACHLM